MTAFRKIIIEAVSASEQRYDTEGDWFFNAAGDLVIRTTGISALEGQAFLVALHELIEAKLCHERRIPQTAVDEFDLGFKGEGEPGDAWNAPYRREHRFAMLIEHLMAHELGLARYGRVE